MADRLQSLAPPESLGAGAPGSPGGADALVPTRGAANPEIQSGKLFVGGLSWETTEGALQAYFEPYGKIAPDGVKVMSDPNTGRSRGFGFVVFEDAAVCQVVVDGGPHTLDGRSIDPKFSVPRGNMGGGGGAAGGRGGPGGGGPGGGGAKTKKIFVGGLTAGTDEDKLREFFTQYGTVAQDGILLMYDRETQRPRGFGFVTFEDEGVVEKLTQQRFVELDGKQVEAYLTY
eukprot:gene13806-28356_t